jgi:dienelactone hydrolase
MQVETVVRELEIPSSGGRTVRADFRPSARGPDSPLVVACHGFLAYKRWGFFPYLSDRLAGSGCHVLTMSFSMNGVDEDTGLIARPDEFARNTVSAEIDDLAAVREHVRRGALAADGVRGGVRGLFGHSRGGSVAILCARSFGGLRSIVTWSTLGTLDRYTARRKARWREDGALVFADERSPEPLRLDYGYWKDIEAHREAFDLPAAAASLAAPHLMVHGDRDGAVTLRETRALVAGTRAAEARLEVIHGAGHTFNVPHPMSAPTHALEQAVRLTTDWFTRTIGTAREEHR